MDYDLMAALEEAWRMVGPKLAGDPGEMAARKGRRRMKTLMRPPRAWCLGVRACDRRMTDYRFAMVPHRIKWADREAGCWRYVEHEVTLDAQGLRWLCRPVAITWPGEEVKAVAERLGVHPLAVLRAARRVRAAEKEDPTEVSKRGERGGRLEVRLMKGPGGTKRMVLYRRGYFDPSAIPWDRVEDAEWGTMWRFVSDHIPADLSQTLARRPVMRTMNGVHAFRGWKWVCPGCKREVNRVYYPVAGLVRARFVGKEKEGSLDEIGSAPCFACARCHAVSSVGRIDKGSWNVLVAYLSGGLLYGREVKRPEWYVPLRRRQPRTLGRSWGKRRREVERMLVETELTHRQLAVEMGMTKRTLGGWVAYVYKMNGVHSRGELREKILGANQGVDRERAPAAGGGGPRR